MGITEIIEKLQDLQYQLDDTIDSGDWDGKNRKKI